MVVAFCGGQKRVIKPTVRRRRGGSCTLRPVVCAHRCGVEPNRFISDAAPRLSCVTCGIRSPHSACPPLRFLLPPACMSSGRSYVTTPRYADQRVVSYDVESGFMVVNTTSGLSEDVSGQPRWPYGTTRQCHYARVLGTGDDRTLITVEFRPFCTGQWSCYRPDVEAKCDPDHLFNVPSYAQLAGMTPAQAIAAYIPQCNPGVRDNATVYFSVEPFYTAVNVYRPVVDAPSSSPPASSSPFGDSTRTVAPPEFLGRWSGTITTAAGYVRLVSPTNTEYRGPQTCLGSSDAGPASLTTVTLTAASSLNITNDLLVSASALSLSWSAAEDGASAIKWPSSADRDAHLCQGVVMPTVFKWAGHEESSLVDRMDYGDTMRFGMTALRYYNPTAGGAPVLSCHQMMVFGSGPSRTLLWITLRGPAFGPGGNARVDATATDPEYPCGAAWVPSITPHFAGYPTVLWPETSDGNDAPYCVLDPDATKAYTFRSPAAPSPVVYPAVARYSIVRRYSLLAEAPTAAAGSESGAAAAATASSAITPTVASLSHTPRPGVVVGGDRGTFSAASTATPSSTAVHAAYAAASSSADDLRDSIWLRLVWMIAVGALLILPLHHLGIFG